MSTHLFNIGEFRLHSGQMSDFKIDCDALADNDLAALAFLYARRHVFGEVVSVPTGGDRFAAALAEHSTDGPSLIVDDVWTTGGSMRALLTIRPVQQHLGVVIFARSRPDGWVTPLFMMGEEL